MNDLINRLNSTDEAERLYAAQDIADAGRTDLAPVLVKRLELEESQAVREAIVCSLKAMPCPDIYQGLFELFSSLDAYLRNAAVAVFGAQRDEAVAFLSLHFGHGDREVRKLILDALFQLGTPEATVAIRRGIRDSAVNVKITAVEYLGRLEDSDTVDEMLALFREEPEPMLRTSILEALSLVGNGAATDEVLRILAPGGDFSQVDPLYVPEVIILAARTGDVEVICAIIDAVTDIVTYADNVMRAIGQAKRRYRDIICEDRIFEKAMAIAGDGQVPESIRYAAVEHILSGDGICAGDRFYSLGSRLVCEENMAFAGVRLLAAAGIPDGIQKVKTVMEETNDRELRALCEELIETMVLS